MAISGGDGSIILTTKVDESGITKSTTSIKAQFAKVGSYLKTIGTSIQTTFSKVGAGIKNTFSKIGNWFKNFATSIAAQFATIFGLYALINFSKQAGEFATQTEASVQRLVDIYGEAAQSVGDFIDANARAIGMSKASASSFASVYGNLFSVWADQNTNAELTNRYLNMTAVVASKTGRTVQDVQERVRSGLLGNTEAIEDLGVFANVKTIEMTDAFQRMADGKTWEQLDAYTQQQVRTMAILEQATEKYGNTVADTTATTRARYQAAYEDFQNTWGQVVNTILIPVLKILTQVFTIATKGLRIMAGLSGKTVENSGQTSSNIKQQTKEQEKLNKAVKKGLAGFDEINTLTEQSAENTAVAGTGTQVSGIGDLGGNYDNSFVDQINADIAEIMGVVGFALAAIGIIMICFGHIGWGIGFLIAGAGIFSVSQAALSGGITDNVKNKMNAIIVGISFLILILGIILVTTGGSLPLGIGMIISGSVGLATEVTLNWNVIKGKITKFIQDNSRLIVGISLAILVIGILLCVCGVITPLSIGMIALGAVGLATEIAINWDAMTNAITDFFERNTALFVGIGTALVALGIILLCCGVLPLGIGLLVAGGVSLAAAIAPNWDVIVNKVKSITSAISKIFTAMWDGITKAASSAWNAIIGVFKTGGEIFVAITNGIVDVFKWAINGIIDGINWVIAKPFEGLNLILDTLHDISILGVKPFGWLDWRAPIPKIPKLAQGAVIPPNREFLAVLGDQKHGTNIEAPLDTIKQAVAEVLAQVNIGSGSNGRIEIPVIIDGREIARAVREAENNMGSQTVFGGFANVY